MTNQKAPLEANDSQSSEDVTFKLQSAIEYLTTYGWAVLLIAIALVFLFELGVFNRSPPTQCIIESGFGCANFYMTSNGILVFNLEQQTINPVNITSIACYENSTLLTGQKPYNPPSNQLFMPVGSSQTMYVQCYTSNTITYSGNIGSVFTGTLAIYYTDAITHLTEFAKGSLTVPVSTSEQVSTAGNPDVENSIVLTVTDTTSSPIPSGFQQMFSINPSTFAQHGLNANMSNIEFTTGIGGSGVPVNAWIESGASNTATTSIIWLKLPEGITSNGGTETLYMNFLSNNDPVTSGITGYAPQLWCASGCFQTGYAQYDNGANVFNYYQSFGSLSTLPTGWILTTSNTLTSCSISFSANYIEVMPPSSVTNCDLYTNIPSSFKSFPTIFETYSNIYNPGNGVAASEWLGLTTGINGGDGYALLENGGGASTYLLYYPSYVKTSYLDSNVLKIYGLILPSSTSVQEDVNYINYYTATVSEYTADYLDSVDGTYGGVTSYQYLSWIRGRTYPPNGVMPSVSCTTGTCTN